MLKDPNVERLIMDYTEPLQKQISMMQIELDALKLQRNTYTTTEEIRTLQKKLHQAEKVIMEFNRHDKWMWDKFSEWIEENDWRFAPVSFNGVIKYRWCREGEGIQLTTKELYEWFLEQK